MLSVNNVAFANNSASSGAGLWNAGSVAVNDCTFSNNSASAGGAIFNGVGPLTITNCTFAGNSAIVEGGAIDNAGTLVLVNSTLSNNSSRLTGGGITNGSQATLANTIVAGNSASGPGSPGPDVSGTITSLGHNLIGNTANSKGWLSTDLQNVDPKLAPLANYGSPTQTMALLPGSPALDSGSASITGITVPSLDQRGAARGPAGLNAGSCS